MSRRTSQEKDTDEIEVLDDEVKQPKATRFFSQFSDVDYDFVITLYKKDVKGKRVIVKEFHNEVPTLNTIQETYGGGDYAMYANRYENGKSVAQIDTTTFNLAEPIRINSEGEKVISAKEDFFSYDNLQKLALVKQLFGSEGNNGMSEVLMKMSEMNNLSIMKVMEMQQQSERRMTELIVNMKSEKNNISEMVEMFSLFNELSGSKSESSPMEKLLEIAPMFLSGNNQQPIQQTIQQPIQTIPMKKKSREEEINEVINKIPYELKNKLTEENKENVINIFYERNKDVCTRQDIIDVVEEMLKRKSEGKL